MESIATRPEAALDVIPEVLGLDLINMVLALVREAMTANSPEGAGAGAALIFAALKDIRPAIEARGLDAEALIAVGRQRDAEGFERGFERGFEAGRIAALARTERPALRLLAGGRG
jgi:hypothetical protein